ncbi:MAG: helix-turn-helix domain-containing protein [Chloroflexi bacterium]|nr:helix-turn-helix domain-containing protein [Chloroflexota bacterium]
MTFFFEERFSDIPFVEKVWQTQSEQAVTFMSQAASHWEMVVTKYQGKTTLTIRGPETKATLADCPAGVEFLGIVFKMGTFMPHLPTIERLNRNDISLPEATRQTFWLNGSVWQFPTYNNADTFVDRLVRQGVLMADPVVEAVLQGQPPALSPRTVQYRFLRATGLPLNTIQQIERARQALTLLRQGLPILDTVHEVGYFDQPHLTRALKRFIGQTPSQITPTTPP